MTELPLLLLVTLLIVSALWLRSEFSQRLGEQRANALFNNTLIGMARISPHGRWIAVNPTLCRILDTPAGQLIGRHWLDILDPDERAIAEQRFAEACALPGSEFTHTHRLKQAGPIARYASLAFQPVWDKKSEISYFTLLIEDITARHEAERKLSRQVARSEAMVELPQRAETLSEPTFMQYATGEAERLTGSQIAFMHFVNDDEESIELVAWSNNTLAHYCHATYQSHYPVSEAGIWADAIRQRDVVIVNDYAQASNRRGLPEGHSPLHRLLCVPVIENGKVCMVTGVGNKSTPYGETDVDTVRLIGNETWRIARRARVDKALQLAMQVVNASPVVCFRWQASNGWPVVFVSDNIRQWGYTPEQLITGQPLFADIVHPEDLPRVADEVMRHTASGCSNYEQEYRLITAEKQLIWVVDRTQVIRDTMGLPLFYDGVLTDITDRKTQQLLLADNLKQQQALNKRLEEANNQLLQSEKMASIGQLAAGVAHELNNPIGFVHSNLGTLDGYLHDLMAIIDGYEQATTEHCTDPAVLGKISRLREERDFAFLKADIFSLVAESKDGLNRVKKIVQDLKSFSRVGEQEWQEADLHQGLESTLNIVWNELKYKCQVIKDYGDLPPVYCLISQLNQVFMNLLVNASQAIDKQGTVTLRTCCLDNDKVCIEISDTGCGIPAEHLSRIFDPFFTTKPVGQGTGLGLSLSYSIVQRHQGQLTVRSTPGQGTSFRVILPIHPSTASTPAPEAAR